MSPRVGVSEMEDALDDDVYLVCGDAYACALYVVPHGSARRAVNVARYAVRVCFARATVARFSPCVQYVE